MSAQIGRPSDYTIEIADRICQEIMLGKSLRKICEIEGMPVLSTICLWLLKNKEFSEQYVQAREVQAEIMADDIIDISDDSRNDTQEDEEGNEIVNHDNIQRSKLRVDSRKWVAIKLLPKKYGEKTTSTNITGIDLSNLSNEELDALRKIAEKVAS